MKVAFVSNRGSGKTTLAYYEFLKNPEKSIYMNVNAMRWVDCPAKCQQYTNTLQFTTCSGDIERAVRLHNCTRIIMDDYLEYPLDVRRELYNILPVMGINDIYIFTAPQKLYHVELAKMLTEIKRGSGDGVFDDKLNELLGRYSSHQISDLYFNYVNDPDTVLIGDEWFINKNIKKRFYESVRSKMYQIDDILEEKERASQTAEMFKF